MKLKQLKIKNFRGYKDETIVDLDDLVVLVGRNDSGKSTIFDALNIFFDEKSAPDKDDKCVFSDNEKIRITCVFSALPSMLVIDAQYPTNLKEEYLLNNQGLLEISKEYDCTPSKPKLKRVYAHAFHPLADDYSDLLTLTNVKLKQRALDLNLDLSSVNQSVNTELRRAIRAQAEDLKCGEVEIDLKAEDAKNIWELIKKHLPVFAIFKSDRPSTDQDAEAQDPMKIAVKEAIRSQEDKLNEIAEMVKMEVQEIANRTVDKIAEMNPELAQQLTPRVSNKNWDSLFSVSLTGDEDIPINKRGSGTRRLVLLNFFRAKAEQDAENISTALIYAIEEPETSQHPHNQLILVKALEDLAEREGCQVFLTTHTPMLARRFNHKSLRLVTRKDEVPIVCHGVEEATINDIIHSLGILPDHNIKVFFGVEGRNDITFLRGISKKLHDAGEDVPDLAKAEDEGHLVFVPLGGSSLDLWVSRLEGFNRPEFYLFDRDYPPPRNPHYKDKADQINLRPKCKAWHTAKRELENYIPKELILEHYSNYQGVGDDFEDVPALFAQAVHESSDSDCTWEEVINNQDKFKNKISKAKKRLSKLAVEITPESLKSSDPNNDICGWLKEIGMVLNAAN